MVEKARRSLNSYLRREDTILTGVARRISPKKGSEYLSSRIKRAFDVSVAIPLLIASLPVQGAIKLLIKLEDGGDSIYVDNNRFIVDSRGAIRSFPMRKFRTMKLNADSINVPEEIRGTDNDPRLSRVGRIIRRLNFDELPQLRQVIKGEMSLIGIRTARMQDTFQTGNMKTHPNFPEWLEGYSLGKPAIFNPQAALYGNNRKGGDYGQMRLHSDNLYTKKASLGLDLYLAFRFIFGIKKRRSRSNNTLQARKVAQVRT